MLRILLINFIIAIVGFGSGTVFIALIYDGYLNYSDVSIQTLDLVTSIAMLLPGPVTPKMLGLIAYLEYGVLFIIPAIIIFVIPTLVFITYSYKYYERFKDSNFFKFIATYFMPLLAAITLTLLFNLIGHNVVFASSFYLFIIPMLSSLIAYFFFKVEHRVMLLMISTISYLITTISI